MQKLVYLTIDDSPSKNMMEKADYLLKKRIPAIFFCIGHLMEKNPDAILYAIKKGFIIGNHSYSHPFFSKIPLEQCYQEIAKTDKIIENLYSKANKKRPAKLFRFPYGDKGGQFINTIVLDKSIMINQPIGKKKKNKIQRFLKDLGYSQPKFDNINYKYFKKFNLNKDQDIF